MDQLFDDVNSKSVWRRERWYLRVTVKHIPKTDKTYDFLILGMLTSSMGNKMQMTYNKLTVYIGESKKLESWEHCGNQLSVWILHPLAPKLQNTGIQEFIYCIATEMYSLSPIFL